MGSPNPPVTIAGLLGLPSAATIRAAVVNMLVTAGIRADLWPPGDSASSLLTDVTQEQGSSTAAVIQAAVAAGWLPTASGGWLTWLAYYLYGITNAYQLRQSTFATGAVSLTAGSSPLNFAPGQATFQNAVPNAQGVFETYTNTTAIAVGAGGTQTVQVQCVDAGTQGNAAPGTITNFVTTMLGATVTNPAPVLGTDGISDANLQTLCFNSLGARSVRGPQTAYQYAIQIATNAITGTLVNINRWLVSSSSHTGQVTVYVAGPDGVTDPNDVAGVVTSIAKVAKPECVQVTVTAATAVDYAPAGSAAALTVYMAPLQGLTQAAVQNVVVSAIDSFLSQYPISGLTADGETGVLPSGIAAAVGAAISTSFPGSLVYDVDNTCGDGTGYLALAPGQVPVSEVTPSDVTVIFGTS
jgi:hypothetical protein